MNENKLPETALDQVIEIFCFHFLYLLFIMVISMGVISITMIFISFIFFQEELIYSNTEKFSELLRNCIMIGTGSGFVISFAIGVFSIPVLLINSIFCIQKFFALKRKGYTNLSTENLLKISRRIRFTNYNKLPGWEEVGIIPSCSQTNVNRLIEIFKLHQSYQK